ncbi:MAG: hypothetical protein M5U28_18670 [Sandaracinaceae bacterium]|nr:hypothetical protein [Sandaracinaceae bacterium]
MPYRDEVEALRARVEGSRGSSAAPPRSSSARARRSRARWRIWRGLPPEADIPWRSLHGGEPIVVHFVNATDKKLELVWISYDGQARPSATIIPGGERDERTYVAHLWRVIDPASGAIVLQRYVRAGDAVITAR